MKKEKLDIVYEDKYLIVVNKKAGMLTISSEKEKEKTLFHELLSFMKQKNKNNKIFIVHRLDMDTSGLIIFAKNEEVKNKLQNNWENVYREYIAIVNGKVKKSKDIIKSYLEETKTNFVYISKKNDKSSLAITEYEKIGNVKGNDILKIVINTGKKHQIRVQLAYIGNPIVGDKKYGLKNNNPYHRMMLHANKLIFKHPITNKEIVVESLSKDFPKNIN